MTTMRAEQINQFSAGMLMVLALVAFGTVLSGYILPAASNSDEGTAAHLFQLAMIALVPVGLLFLGSAEWTQPARNIRRLVLPAVTVVVAFAALYYLEHFRLR